VEEFRIASKFGRSERQTIRLTFINALLSDRSRRLIHGVFGITLPSLEKLD
jgi:hypothetical protein